MQHSGRRRPFLVPIACVLQGFCRGSVGHALAGKVCSNDNLVLLAYLRMNFQWVRLRVFVQAISHFCIGVYYEFCYAVEAYIWRL